MTRIAAGLESAFARRGFAVPSVEDLRDAAGVSLRTLYKYAPSRDRMVRIALEHRHRRYLDHVFSDLPMGHEAALDALFERIGLWMERETSHGCLFHAAVAANPDNNELKALLERHKSEVAERAAGATGLSGRKIELMQVIEGLTQSWPLYRERATTGARHLGAALRRAEVPGPFDARTSSPSLT
ncbi:TetR/AcrR family transcriptional regulator [Stappia stellulata]|uniref:TetR/AcrR family transcriptional regulator n=1 Tax=Stappia stellulata TaxID=71235 RepID=UPI001CD766A6|nr:TetR/AcrR family transcriptional regulator [Stappia stellulata]MCA1244664.1 TetR/AcrR family transcriptional regulator [Stappia stellulata]